MTNGNGQITEKSVVKLTISSWFQVASIIGCIVWFYFAIRSDVSAAVLLSQQNASDIKSMQVQTQDMRLQLYGVSDDLKYFRQQYERDMSQYIREPQRKP